MPVWVVVLLGSNGVQVLKPVKNNHTPLVQWWFTTLFPPEILWYRVPNRLENVLVWQVTRAKVVWIYAIIDELLFRTRRPTMYCFYTAYPSTCRLFCQTFLWARVECTWKLLRRVVCHLGRLVFSSKSSIFQSACRPTTPVSVGCINQFWSGFLSVRS